MRMFLPLLLLCSLLATSPSVKAQNTLFFDDFEAGATAVWSESPSGSFVRLATSRTRSYSGSYSAHTGSVLDRRVSSQAFTPVSKGKVSLSWRLFLDGISNFDTATFFLNAGAGSSSLGFEMYLADLAVLDSDWVPGVASLASGVWHDLAINYDFDTLQAEYVVDGKQVRQSKVMISAFEQITFRADDPNLYIDDVWLSQQLVEEAPSNSPVFSDDFESAGTAKWSDSLDNTPRLVASPARSHGGTQAVHASAQATGLSTVSKDFTALFSGQLSASWWVLADGSVSAQASSFSLGKNLAFNLDQSGTKLTLVAFNDAVNVVRPDIRTLERGRWYQLAMAYDFSTGSATYSLDGVKLDEVKLAIDSIAYFTLLSGNPSVYVDDVLITHTDPGPQFLAPAQIGPLTFVQERGLTFNATVEKDIVHVNWESVPEADGYRLYYHPTAFTSLAEIAYFDAGKATQLDARLPFGSYFYVVIAAMKGSGVLVISNSQEIDIPPLSLELLSHVDSKAVMSLRWSELANVANYRAYYSDKPFKDTAGIPYVDMGTKTSFDYALFSGASYYIGMTAAVPGNKESALSNIQHVTFGSTNPVFPAPPPPDPDIIDYMHMYGPVVIDEFGFQWGRTIVPRPPEPQMPALDPLQLNVVTGTATNTTIAANVVSLPAEPTRGDNYRKYSNDGVIDYHQLGKIAYYAKYLSAFAFQEVNLSLDVTFGAQDLGQFVYFRVKAFDDSGKQFFLTNAKQWTSDSTKEYAFARGIATSGRHSVRDIPMLPGGAGTMRFQISYETAGFAQVLRRVEAAPVFITINAAYKKLDNAGRQLPDSAENWSCVTDVKTGLIWENKTSDRGLRDGKHTYTWYDSSLAALVRPYVDADGNQRGMLPNRGTCVDSTNCDTEKYTQQVNAAKLCGASDWRLPTKDELTQIVRDSAVGFPWSQSKYLPYGRNVWSGTWSENNDWVYEDAFNFPGYTRERRFPDGQTRTYSTGLMLRPRHVVLVRKAK